MSSTRPIRSTRIKPIAPVLDEIIYRINTLNEKYYENIRNEINAVTKYFKENEYEIANFWFQNGAYNLLDFKHIYLVKSILGTTGLKSDIIVEYLNRITDDTILSKLGAIRVDNGKKVFYRIRVGLNTE
jgi:hypothetical protein